MSTKTLTSLSNDNQNLQKQMGCMNGIFQLFDRHRFLTGRSPSSHNHKKMLPGPKTNVELASAKEKATQWNREIGYEKHRTSTESSRTSTSSSFSSVDHNTSSKPSQTSSRPLSFSEMPHTIPAENQESPIPLGHQSPDIRDVVKDAMHREARRVSIKMVAKEEGKNNVMKHIDSPRPLHNPDSWKPSVAGADRSIQSLAKYIEAPRVAKEEMDTSVQKRLKDPPRFSCDGRELREATRSKIKLKEHPRLSLDSRDTRGRQASDLTPTSVPRDSGGERDYSQTHEPSSNKRSTLIAKLMGLEPFPDHHFSDQRNTTASEGDSISRSSLSADLNRQNNIPLYPRLQRNLISQGQSKSNFLMKTTANSRLPLEQAPWRQQNANREPHGLVEKNKEALDKGCHTSTIYGQIEKRITDHEFKGSGKDFRALKQILEAMQKTRNRLENQHEEVDLESQTSGCSIRNSSCNQQMRSPIKHNEEKNHVVTTIKSSSPQELVDKSSPHTSAGTFSQFQKLHVQDGQSKGIDSVHKRIGRNQRQVRNNPQQAGRHSPHEENYIEGRVLTALQLPRETRNKKEQNVTVPTKSSGSMSTRTRHKEHVLEKKNQNNPSTSLPIARAQSRSPTRKSKVKSIHLQGEDRKYKLDRGMGGSFHQDAVSQQSESNNSSASQVDTDFTLKYSYENECKQQGSYKNRDLAPRLRNNTPIAELVIPTAEQLSPVSVLDASFYREDSPSPVKKIPTPFTDDDTLDPDEVEWSPQILDHLQETGVPNLSVELYNRKMEEIRSLVHKLDQLNIVPHEDTTDHIESLSDNTNPHHRYITKILLASGLLKDISYLSIPIQLHSNGYVINPKLFHVLEQTDGERFSGKTSEMKVNQKIQRKIVFDTVNEILAHKQVPERFIPPNLRSGSGIQLLKEIHFEVERLQKLSYSSNDEDENHDQVLSIFGADIAHESESWKDFGVEIPSLVLDIERLIFKDLISEAINDEIRGQQNWPKNSRKLLNN